MAVETFPRTRQFDSRKLAPSVHWAQFHADRKGPGLERRIYDFILLYVAKGSVIAHFGDGATEKAGPGDLLLLPSCISHRIELTDDEGASFIGIHFDFYDELDVEYDHEMIVQEETVRMERFCYWTVNAHQNALFERLYPAVPPEIRENMADIVREHNMRRSGFELVLRGKLLEIFAGMLRLHRQRLRNRHIAYGRSFLELSWAIESNPGYSWSNPEMARRCSVSEDHFIRVFKEIIGMTPRKYVQTVRHREAKRMLRETSCKIEEIGCKLGYGDLQNFSHTFKKWQKVSPREYRRLFVPPH